MLEDVMKQAMKLPLVSTEAAKEYKEKIPMVIEYVNKAMNDNRELERLLGDISIEVMHDNHNNHAHFMSNVFQLGIYEIMVKVVVWVYRSYHARGISYDYFRASLRAWTEAVEANLIPAHAQEIKEIYKWLIECHQQFIDLASNEVTPEYERELELQKIRMFFVQKLLEGDSRACLKLASESVHNAEDVKKFYMQVMQPAMYEIGYGWEKGRISIAQEHLASAIISRIMTSFYQNTILEKTPKQKVAVVAATANEFHEIGAHMVADFLEMDGWNVYYMGANTPLDEIIRTIEDKKPFLLAISVTMPFNLDSVKNTIDAVRKKNSYNNLKIMTGGQSCNMGSQVWEKLGSDGWAGNAQEAVELADRWYTRGT